MNLGTKVVIINDYEMLDITIGSIYSCIGIESDGVHLFSPEKSGGALYLIQSQYTDIEGDNMYIHKVTLQ